MLKNLNKIARDTNLFLSKYLRNQKYSDLLKVMNYGLFPGGKKILLLMTMLLTIFIIVYLWNERKGHPLIKYGLVFILSGAFGNLIDRIRDGGVVDFISVGWWPAFNIADSAISIGILILIFTLMFGEKLGWYSVSKDKDIDID